MIELLHAVAGVLNALRVVPRIMIGIALYIWWDLMQWIMTLEDPTMTQGGFVSIVTGAITTWAGLYMSGGNKK